MPPREWKLRVEDMLEAIARVERYTEGMSLQAFRDDQKTIDAVARNFGILGEAARHVPPEVTDRHATVPWSLIGGMRHVVVHEYFGVSVDIVWEAIRHDLPPLVPQLREVLEDEA